jgi:hypothetical protein
MSSHCVHSVSVCNTDLALSVLQVVYTDGDAEEMEWDELSTWLVPQEANGTAEAGPSGTQVSPGCNTSPAPGSEHYPPQDVGTFLRQASVNGGSVEGPDSKS